jgi:hypothetical protein
MCVINLRGRGKRTGVFLVLSLVIVLGATIAGLPLRPLSASDDPVLRIYDLKTGEIYAEARAQVGGTLFFGWEHSLEKIPWNEYYHIDENCKLILDAITFPAFGAGIPENKGRICYIKDGLIHMEEIDQLFDELVWLNSHTATRDIRLDGKLIARGRDLPQRTRLRLVVERRREKR